MTGGEVLAIMSSRANWRRRMALLSVVTNLFDRVGGIGMTSQQPIAPPQKEEDGMANSSVTALSATVSMPLSPPPLCQIDS